MICRFSMIFGLFFCYQYYFGLSKLVKREDGWSYFTGRGCGTIRISSIKYFVLLGSSLQKSISLHRWGSAKSHSFNKKCNGFFLKKKSFCCLITTEFVALNIPLLVMRDCPYFSWSRDILVQNSTP